ncbi:hypothetical protein D3C76_1287140 [compost metagenome]
MDVGHRAIKLGTHLEHPDHIQTLHARRDATWRTAHFRHDQGQFVTDIQPKTPGADLADHYSVFARYQRLQAALDDMLGNDRDLALLGRVDTADLNRLHRPLVGKHAFHFGDRRCRYHGRVLQRSVGGRAPVLQRLHPKDRGVRHQAKNSRTHLALKAVHHRQHHDHRQHAQ